MMQFFSNVGATYLHFDFNWIPINVKFVQIIYINSSICIDSCAAREKKSSNCVYWFARIVNKMNVGKMQVRRKFSFVNLNLLSFADVFCHWPRRGQQSLSSFRERRHVLSRLRGQSENFDQIFAMKAGIAQIRSRILSHLCAAFFRRKFTACLCNAVNCGINGIRSWNQRS